MRVALDFAERGRLRGAEEFAVPLTSFTWSIIRLQDIHNFHLHALGGFGEVIHLYGLHLSDGFVPIQMSDNVLPPLMQVHGALVDADGRGDSIHFADDDRTPIVHS